MCHVSLLFWCKPCSLFLSLSLPDVDWQRTHLAFWKLFGPCERVWLLKIFTQSVGSKNESDVLLWVAFQMLRKLAY